MKIIADEHIPYIKEYFGDRGELVLKPGRAITADIVNDADMLLVRTVTRVDEALLAGSSVKFVGSVTAGHDHLDTAWLEKAGITWCVASGFNSPPVADYVMSCVAALDRKNLLPKIRPKAAVIGVGNVGSLVVERLKQLNVEVIVCDPVRAESENDFKSVALDDIADVDLITVHVPLVQGGNHPTYHFIDKDFLRRQKSGCVFLNASRGAVVNSIDLLQYGTHLLWCLDVWEHEPIVDTMILEQALIATPHIAGYSLQSKIRGIEMIYQKACQSGMIERQALAPVPMPYQELAFAGSKHHWQDIALGIFNPLIQTALMRIKLMDAGNDAARLFDEMRQQFNFRYEFGFTKVIDSDVADADIALLHKWGVRF